jgi:hypothetical protein
VRGGLGLIAAQPREGGGSLEMFPDWLAAGLVSPDADAVPVFSFGHHRTPW